MSLDAKARDRAYSAKRRLEGKAAEEGRRYIAKKTPARLANIRKSNHSPRHHAHNRMRKYGITLGQAEKMGVIPPDVQEALSGNHQA